MLLESSGMAAHSIMCHSNPLVLDNKNEPRTDNLINSTHNRLEKRVIKTKWHTTEIKNSLVR